MRPSSLVEALGGRYAQQLGIDLNSADLAELQKWLLASLLFGARISEKLAIRAYREFERADVLGARKILSTGWDGLVAILDRGGYARYDFKTATKPLEVYRTLLQEYQADLNRLHDAAANPQDLVRRLENLGKGIGDVTAGIFLRELRGIWKKADPLPSERTIRAARALGFIGPRMRQPQRILRRLQAAWQADGNAARDFADFEAALVRYAVRPPGSNAPAIDVSPACPPLMRIKGASPRGA